jgi:phage terminase large subunit GpA-like protein
VTTCVDTGAQGWTDQVLDFCHERRRRRVRAIKGAAGMQRPVWPPKASKTKRKTRSVWIVGVDSAKATIYARLRQSVECADWPASGPGVSHFPVGLELEYFEQLTVERWTTRYHKGRATHGWVKPKHARNEAIDCRVYAYAGLRGWLAQGRTLEREALRLLATIVEPEDKDEPKKRKAWIGKRRGWVGGRRGSGGSPGSR